MPNFRGFKATFNLSSSNRISADYYEDVPVVSMSGAYRTNREEFYGNGSLSEPAKKITPSMIKLPQSRHEPAVRPSKSTSNLQQPNTNNLPPNLRQSTPNVSADPQGPLTVNRDSTKLDNIDRKKAKIQEKEQKKIEKQRLADQKKKEKLQAQERAKQEKLQAQEQAKQEKLRKEREKAELQRQAKEAKANKGKNKSGKKSTPVQQSANPLAQGTSQKPQIAQQRRQGPPQTTTQGPAGPVQYSTNTLESSISRSSGPPPYSEAPKANVIENEKDNTGNTSFGKPVDSTSSWDMINQHRDQINRPPTAGGSKPNQRVMDLQYNPGRPSGSSSDGKGNSEA